MPDATTTATSSDHRLQVGSRTQKIIAELLRRGAVPARSELTTVARHVFSESPVEYRPRESLLEAVTAAGVYLNRLRPPSSWTFVGSELHHSSCRFDVVWAHATHGHLIDEIKLGVGRGGELAVRDQVDRYLEVGSAVWPDLVGVRLCAVHEPAASRLYLPGQRRSALVSASDLVSELAPR
jgi:hypothetical protein